MEARLMTAAMASNMADEGNGLLDGDIHGSD